MSVTARAAVSAMRGVMRTFVEVAQTRVCGIKMLVSPLAM
jgi:hypothetical protein